MPIIGQKQIPQTGRARFALHVLHHRRRDPALARLLNGSVVLAFAGLHYLAQENAQTFTNFLATRRQIKHGQILGID